MASYELCTPLSEAARDASLSRTPNSLRCVPWSCHTVAAPRLRNLTMGMVETAEHLQGCQRGRLGQGSSVTSDHLRLGGCDQDACHTWSAPRRLWLRRRFPVRPPARQTRLTQFARHRCTSNSTDAMIGDDTCVLGHEKKAIRAPETQLATP